MSVIALDFESTVFEECGLKDEILDVSNFK
jgi:hypothetical protein